MQFRTELNPVPSPQKINLADKIITLGSCFADEIGAKLNNSKFNVMVNPFGTTYNPISQFQLLNYCLKEMMVAPEGFIERDGLFFHHDFHSSWFDKTREALQQKLNHRIEAVNQSLKDCNVLMITFGTAWCYESIASNSVVNNCHKLPNKDFKKYLLTQKQILNGFEMLHGNLVKFNPKLKIILTVSPVRHIKDTIELNSVSKATLRLACDTIINQYENTSYFPAYEILMDDLRDYRFYNADLIHPTEQAVDYTWQKFSETYFDKTTFKFIAEWNSILQALNHKPFHAEGVEYQRFLDGINVRLTKLSHEVDVTKEIELVNALRVSKPYHD